MNSDDARHVPTVSGDIIQDSALSVDAKMKVVDWKQLLQMHGYRLSPSIACCTPTFIRRQAHFMGLHLISNLCGNGRVILIGNTTARLLPNNLRAFVLDPFGLFDNPDVRTPFITGQYFELATCLSMRLRSYEVVILLIFPTTR